MSPEERDEKLLQEYLEGDSELSRRYRREADEQPDAQLDARILAEARRAVAPGSRGAHSPFTRHWMVPTSLAAVLVLSVSVLLLMPDPAVEPGIDRDRAVQPTPSPAAVGAPEPAEALRLRRRASESEEDVAGERPSDATPREPAAAYRVEDKAADESGSKREAERRSVTGGEAQSLPAVPAPGRAAEQAASQAVPAKAPESAPRPEPMPTDAVRADPAAWLRFIESLLNTQDRESASSNLRAFRATYPDYPLPSTLVPLAASLDAERP